jgi:hypothetical protein
MTKLLQAISAFFLRNFGMGEILFVIGMLLLHRGVSVSFTVAWANTVCGGILILIGFITGRQV